MLLFRRLPLELGSKGREVEKPSWLDKRGEKDGA